MAKTIISRAQFWASCDAYKALKAIVDKLNTTPELWAARQDLKAELEAGENALSYYEHHGLKEGDFLGE